MAAVSVIVPARDARATLPALLDALGGLDPVPGGIEVVVADDGSTDGTGQLARAHPAVTRVVHTGSVGPGAARNAAVAVATGDVIAFTDADCAPEPGWLAAALSALEAGADVVQGVVMPDGPVGPFDRTVRVDAAGLFETANLVVRAPWLARVGGFEPWLTPRGGGKELGEDVWLGWRMSRAGARVAFVPGARVRHAVFPGTPASSVAEQARLRFFPAIVARIPELRPALTYRGVFLSSRTAAFDLAALGVAVTVGAGRREGLVLVLPYARDLWRAGRVWGVRRGPAVVLTRVAADAVGAGALVAGSVRARCVLL